MPSWTAWAEMMIRPRLVDVLQERFRRRLTVLVAGPGGSTGDVAPRLVSEMTT